MLLGHIPPRQIDIVPGHLQSRVAEDLLKAEGVATVADVEHGEGVPQRVW